MDVEFGDGGLSRKTTMKFTVIRAPSPYNVILGRSGLKALQAIPSTIHAMMKFPTPRGIATIYGARQAPTGTIISHGPWCTSVRARKQLVN
ncbi:hypothetical protein CTI12_AA288700 [Artemisia annua]|uniref:Reverse transcriptase domain-containing protein n=1 Tax=Artemisia annua TaxID=35608 RepID=A0A2U1MC45_ARTAN|nr:hypothetical protein CTI12_AA288700 [Artemisia annua]